MTAKQRRVEARSTVTRRAVPGAAGARARWPCPWTTPAGPTGAACATASPGVARRNQVSPLVHPSLLLDKSLPYDPANPAVASDPVFQLRTLLLESERYLLNAQYLEKWFPWRASRSPTYWPGSSRAEPGVRDPPAGRWQRSPPLWRPGRARTATARPGAAATDAIRYADFLVRSIACEHVAVTPGGWGASFQTAHWATLTGEAAWLLWDQAHPQTREYVAQMLAYEADDQTTSRWSTGPTPRAPWSPAATPGQRTIRGTARPRAGPVDDADPPARGELASQGGRPRGGAYSRLSDINAPTMVNGVSLADRLDGANTYDDGTVENHHILHPDYMTNIQHNWWAFDFAGLAGRQAPASALQNGALVYGAFSTLSFTAGAPSPVDGAPYAEPGGTMYKPGSNDIYFPEGSTWGVVRRAPVHLLRRARLRLRAGLDGRVVGPGRAEPAPDRAADLGGQQRHRRRADVQL
jgi:hypothetical protein